MIASALVFNAAPTLYARSLLGRATYVVLSWATIGLLRAACALVVSRILVLPQRTRLASSVGKVFAVRAILLGLRWCGGWRCLACGSFRDAVAVDDRLAPRATSGLLLALVRLVIGGILVINTGGAIFTRLLLARASSVDVHLSWTTIGLRLAACASMVSRILVLSCRALFARAWPAGTAIFSNVLLPFLANRVVLILAACACMEYSILILPFWAAFTLVVVVGGNKLPVRATLHVLLLLETDPPLWIDYPPLWSENSAVSIELVTGGVHRIAESAESHRHAVVSSSYILPLPTASLLQICIPAPSLHQ